MRLFTATTATLFLVALVHAQGFREFRIPAHRIGTVSLSTSMYGSGGTGHSDADGSTNISHNGSLYLNGRYYYDSEELGWQIEPEFSLPYSTSRNKNRQTDTDGNRTWESINANLTEELDVSANVIYFPLPSAFGLEAAGRTVIGTRRLWEHYEYQFVRSTQVQTNSRLRDIETNSITYAGNIEVGAGWGRIRNAGGVYTAYEIERKLKELRYLSGDLSSATRQKLIDNAYLASKLFSKHYFAAKYYWQSVETILKSDSAYVVPLDAYAVHRLTEYPVSTISHWRGMRAGLYGRYLHVNQLDMKSHEEYSYDLYEPYEYFDTLAFGSSTTRTRTDDVLFGPRVQGYFPLSMGWQINADSKLERRILPADDGFAWSSYLSVQHLLDDRWSFEYEFEHLRWLEDQKDRNRTHGGAWVASNKLTLRYYLSDAIVLWLSADYFQLRMEEYIPNENDLWDAEDFRKEYQYNLSVSYFLHGRADSGQHQDIRQRIQRGDNYPSTYELPYYFVYNMPRRR